MNAGRDRDKCITKVSASDSNQHFSILSRMSDMFAEENLLLTAHHWPLALKNGGYNVEETWHAGSVLSNRVGSYI
jgi:hypothetical protein